MSEPTFQSGAFYLYMENGNPHLCWEAGQDFWEVLHCPFGDRGRTHWVLLHWTIETDDSHTCNDVRPFAYFDQALVAFSNVIQGHTQDKEAAQAQQSNLARIVERALAVIEEGDGADEHHGLLYDMKRALEGKAPAGCITVSDRGRNAVLAGLRALQYLQADGGHEAIDEIASNAGSVEPLNHDEIEALFKRIDCQ